MTDHAAYLKPMWVNCSLEVPKDPSGNFRIMLGEEVVSWRLKKYDPSIFYSEREKWSEVGRDLIDEYGEITHKDADAERCLGQIIHALREGHLRAYVQLSYCLQPIPRRLWEPDEDGIGPVGWLLGDCDDLADRKIVDPEFPFTRSTVMFLEEEVKCWASNEETNGGKPTPPARLYIVHFDEVKFWIKSVQNLETLTQGDLEKMAKEHFGKRIVRNYHVKKARNEYEGTPRKPGKRKQITPSKP